jgi:HEAT repeat protein
MTSMPMSFENWKRDLESENELVRWEAADQLPDDYDPEEAVAFLGRALEDENELVRTCAADTLGFLDTEAARLALRRSLKTESSPYVLRYVGRSLGMIATPDDLALLASMLIDEETNGYFKRGCAVGLIEFAMTRAFSAITNSCQLPEESWKERSTAFGELTDVVEMLLEKVSASVQLAKLRKGIEASASESDHIAKLLSTANPSD